MTILRVGLAALVGSVLLSAGSLSIDNSGFESADISVNHGGCSGSIFGSTYIYQAAGCGAAWTFEGGTGLTHFPSGFSNPAGPDGSNQAAFVQGSSDFYQIITGVDVGGVYTISFYAVQRTCCDGSLGQTLSVSFGNQALTFAGAGAVQPVAGVWTLYTTDPFVAQNGSDALRFTGNYTRGDATAFVDLVGSTESGVVPEPGTWGLLTGGFAGLVWFRQRKK